jgi:hypothetical protein
LHTDKKFADIKSRKFKKALLTEAYNDFNNLVVTGRLWLKNFIPRNVYQKEFLGLNEPFYPRLASKLAKSGKYEPIFLCKNSIWVSKRKT